MQDEPFDIIVLGAGAAGLAAACELGAAGLRVLILEGRDRPGGRIHTLHDPALPVPVELGAEFIHGQPPELFELARTHRLGIVEVTGEMYWSDDGVLRDGASFGDGMDEVFEELQRVGTADPTFAEFLDSISAKHSPEAINAARQYVLGFDAADPARVGVQAILHEQEAAATSGGDRSFRWLSGYDGVVRALLDGLGPRAAVRYSTVVTDVAWERGSVTVTAQTASGAPTQFRAARAIVTLPLGVLQAPAGERGAVRFVPALPHKLAALEQLVMGQVVRVTFHFATPFWEEPGLIRTEDGEPPITAGFVLGRDPVMPTWWTAYPLQVPTLVGWVGGPAAEKLAEQPDEAIVREALDALSRVFGVERAEVERRLAGYHLHSWHADPFSRGAYSYVAAGGMDAPAALGQPVEDTLFWAGEATDTAGHTGTVHGAIASGRRAAQEVVRTLEAHP